MQIISYFFLLILKYIQVSSHLTISKVIDAESLFIIFGTIYIVHVGYNCHVEACWIVFNENSNNLKLKSKVKRKYTI